MAENFEQLSDDALEPMQLDQTSERRTLRKSFLSISSEELMRRRLIASPKEFSRYPWTSHSRRLTLPIGCGCSSGKPRKLSRTYIGSSIRSERR